MKWIIGTAIFIAVFLLLFETVPVHLGSGAFKRLTTISGIYEAKQENLALTSSK